MNKKDKGELKGKKLCMHIDAGEIALKAPKVPPEMGATLLWIEY